MISIGLGIAGGAANAGASSADPSSNILRTIAIDTILFIFFSPSLKFSANKTFSNVVFNPCGTLFQ
jgi:hypothetical protein